MARLFGDQRRQQQFQIAGCKYPGAATAAGAGVKTVALVRMVSHDGSLCVCLDIT
jgi:hypothetical protein